MIAEILLATYNGEKYLRAQLDSILAQEDDRWRLIASDDGSTDGTAAILDEYAGRYPGKIEHYRSGQRFGNARDHFLHLMRRSRAPYLLFCDQDDVWLPGKVGLTLDALQALEQGDASLPVLAFTDLSAVDERLQVIAPSLTAYQRRPVHCLDWRSLLLQNVVNGCAMGCNQALAQLAGSCREDALLPMHDGWLAVLAARFGRIRYVDEPTVLYRQHGRNSVGVADTRSAGYVMRRLAKLRQLRAMIRGKKDQAAVLARTCPERLTKEDLAFLQRLSARRSGPLFYWKHRSLIHSTMHLLGFMLLG